MSEYKVTVKWERKDQPFIDNKYSRGHTLVFDGLTVPGSSSPHVVPRYSDPNALDPEEAFVSSISSCHMLFFLSIAARRGFRVDSYSDDATGVLSKDEENRFAMTKVTLRPHVTFSGARLPSISEIQEIHHESHEECFIANSVKTEVVCEPVLES
jgi:organic hydroperoxide reductase OsmC/OhrA